MIKKNTMTNSTHLGRSMKLVTLLAVLVPLNAQAATPDAGTILQEITPARPAVPSSSGTGLKVEQKDGSKLPEGVPFEVKRIQLDGNTLFDTDMLHALVADAEEQTQTLGKLEQVVARITDFYHNSGYPLARAIIPMQTIRNGVLRVQVIEAHYGKISIENSSRVNNLLLDATVAPLQSGQVISQKERDHALLLLSDIPGVAVNATLKPGEDVGTSDLLVGVAPGVAVTGNLLLDNYGNRYTGKVRLGGTVSLVNPLHHGDVASLSALSSGGGLSYGRVSYDILLNGQGSHVGAAYSALSYSLGDTLAALQGHGTARIGSLWVRQPLLRGRDLNLYGMLEYDQKQLRDRIDVGGIQTDRSLTGVTASLNGDLRDSLLSGGVNTWKLSWTSGRVGFDNAAARLSDAATAKTEGDFSKWDISVARLQSLNMKNALYFAASGQWANRNLDSAERMSIGGPATVRAYDMGAVSGDMGYVLNLELRHELAQDWQVLVFMDSAYVTANKNPWVTGTNTAMLDGAGLGLNWAGADRWTAKAYIAGRLGSAPVLVGNTSATRAWFEINKGF